MIALRCILQFRHGYQQLTVIFSVNFTTAFEFVYLGIMELGGVSANIIAMMRTYYGFTTARVHAHNNLSELLDIRSDVRQGCIKAPILFNSTADWVIEKALHGFKGGLSSGADYIARVCAIRLCQVPVEKSDLVPSPPSHSPSFSTSSSLKPNNCIASVEDVGRGSNNMEMSGDCNNTNRPVDHCQPSLMQYRLVELAGPFSVGTAFTTVHERIDKECEADKEDSVTKAESEETRTATDLSLPSPRPQSTVRDDQLSDAGIGRSD
nr:unnamed protein product [Spirometra erinaceieuropaei]